VKSTSAITSQTATLENELFKANLLGVYRCRPAVRAPHPATRNYNKLTDTSMLHST
jgi:hypothetical protein